jgi:enoyl-CoA hydratase/carnithine racemase
MRFENLGFETDGSIAVVTLNRPSKRNALSLGLMRELLDCLGCIGNDKQLRAVALRRAVGRKRALQMLLTGEPIDAKVAAEWGLVNSVVPASELRDETPKLASRIAEASSVTMAIGKQAFYAKEIMTMNSMAVDAQEGISAFLGKRAACWTGR